jgi:hypothetical protein
MAQTKKSRTLVQKNVSNVRRQMRKWMENLARSHRGCPSARGCGCTVDQSIQVLEEAERDLFEIELNSYAGIQTDGGGFDHYNKAATDQTEIHVNGPRILPPEELEGK